MEYNYKTKAVNVVSLLGKEARNSKKKEKKA